MSWLFLRLLNAWWSFVLYWQLGAPKFHCCAAKWAPHNLQPGAARVTCAKGKHYGNALFALCSERILRSFAQSFPFLNLKAVCLLVFPRKGSHFKPVCFSKSLTSLLIFRGSVMIMRQGRFPFLLQKAFCQFFKAFREIFLQGLGKKMFFIVSTCPGTNRNWSWGKTVFRIKLILLNMLFQDTIDIDVFSRACMVILAASPF